MENLTGVTHCYDCGRKFESGEDTFYRSNDGGIERYVCTDCETPDDLSGWNYYDCDNTHRRYPEKKEIYVPGN